ncbi:MAG: glycosyltransferase family 2 protein [Bernardetiaceae bacterium]
MKISLVATLLNEEDNIAPLLEQITTALEGWEYEVILVDDGSTDQTVSRVRALASERVKLLVFYRNYGQTTAMDAGIQAAQGQYIATIDGDLQNDPRDIPLLIQTLEEGNYDVVAGVRHQRQDGALLRKLPSKIANRIIRNLTGVHLSDYGCTLKVFRQEIAKNLGLYGELHRFIPVLAVLQGAKITEQNVRHHARIHGSSKYGLGRTSKVISDLILMLFFQKYFRRPIHLFAPPGLLALVSGSLISFYFLILKVFGQDIWGRPLLLLGVILILGGLQLLTFGVIAEVMMRTYYESQNKKPYRIKEVFIGKARA